MFWLLWLFWALHHGWAKASGMCGEPHNLAYQIPGNVTITGIFNVHEGAKCEDAVPSGLEQAAAALWATSLLNRHNYLPGLQIGINVFDGCHSEEETKKAFVESLVLEDCYKPDVVTIGRFVSHDVKKSVNVLAEGLNETVDLVPPLMISSSLFSMAAQLLREMSFTTIHRVVADSDNLLNQFGSKMAAEGICIYDQVLIDNIHSINNEALQPPDSVNGTLVTEGPPVFFLIAESAKIRSLFAANMSISRDSNIVWMVVPTDSVLDIKPEILPNRTYILAAVQPNPQELNTLLEKNLFNDPLNHRLPLKSPIFLAVASKIISLLAPLKEIQNNCTDINETCSEVFEHLANVSSQKASLKLTYPQTLPLTEKTVTQVLQALNIPVDEEMLLFSVIDNSKADDIAIIEIFDSHTLKPGPKLLLIKERRKRSIVRVGIEDIARRGVKNESTTTTTTTEATKLRVDAVQTIKHPCHDASGNLSSSCGICLNFVKYLSKVAHEKQTESDLISVGWRFETWVGVNASVAAIGALCTLAVFVFIFARVCLGDILEGSPALSFFLLIAILIAYSVTLPFSFQSSGTQGDPTLPSIICDLRVAGPPLCYAILFSILLSRSLMLAASDQDGGFMSHVNGYLQAVLIFFTCAVQFAISIEYWIFNSFLLSSTVSCVSMYSTSRFTILLSYDIFLLLLLLAVVPFMLRSKRNYKEGTFFSVAIVVVFFVWVTWLLLFYLLPDGFQDAAVIFGLTGTATAVLVCIFIPRTYMMTTAIVRDRIANTLPPLAHEHQFRSTQALYDTLTLTAKVGTHNPNFYSMNPSDSGTATPQIRPGEYYSPANAGLKPPTLTLSKHGPSSINRTYDTPEPEYDEFASPVRSPRHVTRF